MPKLFDNKFINDYLLQNKKISKFIYSLFIFFCATIIGILTYSFLFVDIINHKVFQILMTNPYYLKDLEYQKENENVELVDDPTKKPVV